MANINLSVEATQTVMVDRDFRQDINLLRGIAILSVVLYHFAGQLLPGGFAGVDVFFVISGYLMTKIIATGLERRSFNLIQFYAARCKRIIPALLIFCTILLLATYLWMPNNEYRKLGNYVGYVALFISNIKLNKEAGDYFATSAHENWFLHTWSLSVEWQFYLILPIILMAVYPFRKRISSGSCLLILTLCSFLACITLTSSSASTRFYLMPYRAWEMLCGGLVWYATTRFTLTANLRPMTAISGYLLIVLSLVFLTTDDAWPGGLTLLPVTGTMLVIYSNCQSITAVFDRNLRWIGLSSYSVYLWHWPVAVYLVYAGQHTKGPWVLGAIALSFIAGWLSWLLIELPAKNYLSGQSAIKFWSIILSVVGAAWLFSYLVKNDFIVSQPNPLVNKIALEANNKNFAANPKTHLSYYGQGKPVAIIVGDSHAEATATALAEAAEGTGAVIGLTASGCPTLADGELKEGKACGQFNRGLSDRLKSWPSEVPVIIVNRLTHYAEQRLVIFDNQSENDATYLRKYAEAMIRMACTLNREHPVYLVSPMPEMPVNVPRTLSHSLMTGRAVQDISVSLSQWQQHNTVVLQAQYQAAQQCGVQVLDPTPYLCHDGRCMGSQNLQPWYFDDNHLSETGNKRLVPMFRKIFAQPH
ncbi:acyltransferase [Yokenella regensburgei]|uniref:acyltransferase family protein n=1 Tax=Yokenella regensburgei TaxID=158877 RepID=UPI003F161691